MNRREFLKTSLMVTAAAAGTASVTLDGTDVVSKEMVEAMLPSMMVKPVRG